MRRMHFATWWDRFVPVGEPESGAGPCMGDTPRMFETYGADLATVQAAHAATPDCVWTLVDDGTAYGSIIPGFRFVNRLGYFITQHPAPADARDVKV